jgi:hypothetical protein
MAGRSDQQRSTVGESRGTRAEDAEAEERATDEGMPEHPGSATSEAAAPHRSRARWEAHTPPDNEPDGQVAVDDVHEADDEHDLGGEA